MAHFSSRLPLHSSLADCGGRPGPERVERPRRPMADDVPGGQGREDSGDLVPQP